jgi:hypothetical protein
MGNISNRYTISNNVLRIGAIRHSFKFPIEDWLETEDMVIVLLDVPLKVQYNENVFGVGLVDNRIWQIEKKQYPPGYRNQCPFVSIVIYEGQLRLNNWCSKYLIVEPLTGKIIEEGDSK